MRNWAFQILFWTQIHLDNAPTVTKLGFKKVESSKQREENQWPIKQKSLCSLTSTRCYQKDRHRTCNPTTYIKMIPGAKISEIFVSIQGEGLWIGQKQLFIRFFGCNISCQFCDTNPTSFQVYRLEQLIQRIGLTPQPFEAISITGGEPLLQAEFLKNFLTMLKYRFKYPILLETNGTLVEELTQIKSLVDSTAMDIKLPSSTGLPPFWREHAECIKSLNTEVDFIKAVICDDTDISDIEIAADIIKKHNPLIIIILQPNFQQINSKALWKNIMDFQDYLLKQSVRTRVVPQLHNIFYWK